MRLRLWVAWGWLNYTGPWQRYALCWLPFHLYVCFPDFIWPVKFPIFPVFSCPVGTLWGSAAGTEWPVRPVFDPNPPISQAGPNLSWNCVLWHTFNGSEHHTNQPHITGHGIMIPWSVICGWAWGTRYYVFHSTYTYHHYRCQTRLHPFSIPIPNCDGFYHEEVNE